MTSQRKLGLLIVGSPTVVPFNSAPDRAFSAFMLMGRAGGGDWQLAQKLPDPLITMWHWILLVSRSNNKAQTRTHPLDIREELKKLEELQATARKEWLGLALPL